MIITHEKDLDTYMAKEGNHSGSGDTFLKAIKNVLGMIRENLYDENLYFLNSQGSSTGEVFQNDADCLWYYRVEDNDSGEWSSVLLPDKYIQFA